MDILQKIEHSLNIFYTKNFPQLPKKFKGFIVKFLPWLTLVIGIFSLLSALRIFSWANDANRTIQTVNDINLALGADPVTARWSFGLYLAIFVLFIVAFIYIIAFTPLREGKKHGWNLLFYALLLNIGYGVLVMFTSFGDFGSLVGTVIGSAIGGYFLFQVRSFYHPKPTK